MGFQQMSQPSSSAPRRIVWESVITVLSAAVLIGAEVFGAAFAGGWALASLAGLPEYAEYAQAILFLAGVAVLAAFIRNGMNVEPFTARG
jgi:membrane protein implicated in regulation of membrane protease activity